MRFAGIFSVTTGILMLVQWIFFLFNAAVPELDTAAIQVTFHLAAEFMTAMVLIAGGVAVLQRRPWGSRVYILATGMLIYAVVNSSGYFMQFGRWEMVGLLAMLLVLAILSLGKVVRASRV